jgi:hypothetical protein
LFFTRKNGTVFWRETALKQERAKHYFDLLIPAMAAQAVQVLSRCITSTGGKVKGTDVSSLLLPTVLA